jgi:glucose/arabinose dehydrogenase
MAVRAGWVAALFVALATGIAGCGDSGAPQTTSAEHEHPGVGLQRVGRFDEPVYVTQPPSGDRSLFVVERRGVVVRVAPDGSASPFLDIQEDVTVEGEGSMTSVAFPPDYDRSGRFYVAYAGRDRRLHLDEFRRDESGESAVPASRRALLSIPHPDSIHWGGLADFGPGGHLYVGTGDGGPDYPLPAVSQDRDSLLGKILRIDPEQPAAGRPYTVPAGNPFAGRPGADEVYALGLRNPWRYSFDRRGGDLWIGDVGDFTEEEVDHLPLRDAAGANFGWPDLEGTAETKSDVDAGDSVPPAVTYKRTGQTNEPVCAVTGGYVERDPAVPKLDGRYLYADFCAGDILSVPARDAEHAQSRPTGLHVPRLASFGEDASGRLYAVSLDGPVYRIVQR